VGLGVSEQEAAYYEQLFDSGKAIVAVKPDKRAADAAQILSRHGGYEMHHRPVSPVPTEGTFSQP